MPAYGDKPGPGVYECPHDGQRVILTSDDDVLMECPSCEGLTFVRVEDAELEALIEASRPKG